MLLERCDRDLLLAKLLPREKWEPFPRAADRAKWEGLLDASLNRERKAYLIENAEKILGQPWPALPAAEFMGYMRDGNRTRYSSLYFERRRRLNVLVLAECFEHEGRFLDEIANGIWAICEEATWTVPAHAERVGGDVLPRQDRESVALFSCETAMMIAEILYLLGDELENLSPALCDRMRRETFRRVIVPVEERDDFWWLSGRNNW